MPERIVYVENFRDGPGGWTGFGGNTEGVKALEFHEAAAMSRSPWWIDYNHAPPGAGYLNLLFALMTKGPGLPELINDLGGVNNFVKGGYPRNFTDAELTVRIRGELEARGAELAVLAQSRVGDIASNWVLTGRPLTVTGDWSEQTIRLVPDPSQWTAMGSRHDRTDFYGDAPLEDVLRDVNVDIILVLFPLDVQPLGPIDGDPHILRAGTQYPVWRSRLPEGYVLLDEIRIAFAEGAAR